MSSHLASSTRQRNPCVLNWLRPPQRLLGAVIRSRHGRSSGCRRSRGSSRLGRRSGWPPLARQGQRLVQARPLQRLQEVVSPCLLDTAARNPCVLSWFMLPKTRPATQPTTMASTQTCMFGPHPIPSPSPSPQHPLPLRARNSNNNNNREQQQHSVAIRARCPCARRAPGLA